MLACAPVRWLNGALPLLCAAGCASARPRGVPARAGPTPAPARESLHVSVQYPGPTDVIQARDSTFLFGAVRGAVGRESLTVGGTTATAYRLPPAADRYVAWLPAAPLCPDGKSACATLEAVAGQDTATAAWPLTVGPIDLAFPTVVVLNDDTAHTGTTDSLTVGKSVPGGTYNWFFPTGTTAVLSGRWNDQARLQLSKSSVAWVNAADVVPLPAGTPPPGGVDGAVRLRPGPASITLRVPVPEKLPFQVAEQERTLTLRLYGVASDINWMQYGGTDPLVTRMSYAQPAVDEVTITLELARRVWGYRTRFDGRDLLL